MMNKYTMLVMALVMTACPPPSEEPNPETTAIGEPIAGMAVTSAAIGPAGGSLTSTDGRVKVQIPAGALSADATISVTPISNLAHGGIGTAYRMSGVETFQQPVSLVFTFTDDELAGTAPEFLDVAFQNADGFWQLADTATLDAAAKTITATTTHFSDWSFVARFRITPSAARVKVDDGKEFHIQHSYPLLKRSAELPTLGFGWYSIGVNYAARLTSKWAVNDIEGGNSTIGTIYANLERGGYGAPSKKPSPATVIVSARVTNPLNEAQSAVLKVPVTVVDDEAAIIEIRARYAKTDQQLTAFVKGDVTDNGFDLNMSFPVVDETLMIADHMGGTVGRLYDTRTGCLMPAVVGPWDQLMPSSAAITGIFLTVSGTLHAAPITLGDGEGDCSADRRTEPARTEDSGFQVQLPLELFDSSPPEEPIVISEDGWTLTFRTLP